jgi:hypothetical protein
MLMPETEERAFLAGMITGTANTLGLQHGSFEWEVLEEEKALRQKLSALVRAIGTWTPLATGPPPFISSDNWSAAAVDTRSISFLGDDSSNTFVQYAQLIEMLSGILQGV